MVPLVHMAPTGAAARSARAGDRSRPTSRRSSSRAASIRGCTRTRSTARTVAAFLSRALGGPLDPAVAADLAESDRAARIPEGETQFEAVEATPGGLRTLAQVALPGRDRARRARTR